MSRLLAAVILTAETGQEVKGSLKFHRKPDGLLKFSYKTRRLVWAFEDLDEAGKETKLDQKKAEDVITALKTIRNRFGAL